MKRKFLALGMALLLAFTFPAVTLSANEISVTVDGQQVNFSGQAPVIVDGRTLVPVRGVFETMGFDVDWNPESRQATLSRANDVIIITIDSETFTSSGTNHTLEVPAQVINGSTMLPIRAVLESVGYSLNWDSTTSTVLITSSATGTTSTEEPEETPEHEETTEAATSSLVGSWYWLGSAYYVLNANGEGTMAGMAIRWTTANGVLSICNTPALCQTTCIAPAEWYYVINGNELVLTSTIMRSMTFTYTRR